MFNILKKELFLRALTLSLLVASSVSVSTKGYAMDKKANQEANQEAPPTNIVSYTLPKNIDPNQLIKGSVVIRCGGANSTGIAIGERHILTAAHVLAAYAVEKQEIQCEAVNSVKSRYPIPLTKSYKSPEGMQCYNLDFATCPLFRQLPISKAHFHKNTSFQETDNSPIPSDLDSILGKYKEAINYGIESGTKIASYGVTTQFIKAGTNVPISVTVFGPDVAILECDAPHHLPALEIADPIAEDRILVHIIGLAGHRYSNEDSSQIIGGTICHEKNMPVFVFIPRIIGQRFKCLPAYEDGLQAWVNRPFIKIVNKQYLMEGEVYPQSPVGFGLIAGGDSGAGAIIVRDGKPYIVGVVSCGEIASVFVEIHTFLSQQNFKRDKIKKHTGGLQLLELYNNSICTKDKNQKWFITQGLSDVTHLKSWIESILLKK